MQIFPEMDIYNVAKINENDSAVWTYRFGHRLIAGSSGIVLGWLIMFLFAVFEEDLEKIF